MLERGNQITGANNTTEENKLLSIMPNQFMGKHIIRRSMNR